MSEYNEIVEHKEFRDSLVKPRKDDPRFLEAIGSLLKHERGSYEWNKAIFVLRGRYILDDLDAALAIYEEGVKGRG